MQIGYGTTLERSAETGLEQRSQSAWRRALYAVVFWTLCAVHLLLPVERGFPVARILGYPFTITQLSSIAVFVIFFIESRGQILSKLPRKYILPQLLIVIALTLAAIIAQRFTSAAFVVLTYFAAFVLDFMIIYYVFRSGYRRLFVSALSATTVGMIVVGLLEGIFRYYLPFYQEWFLNSSYDEMLYAMTRADIRVLGTLGNPILFAVALALVVPFLKEIKVRIVRYLLILGAFAASLLSVSTSATLVWATLGLGLIVLSLRRWRRLLLLLVIVIGVGIFARSSLSAQSVSVLDATVERLLTGNPDSVESRQVLVTWALDRIQAETSFVTIFLGSGPKSSANDVYNSNYGRLSAVDNMYVTFLYDTGVVGLASFCILGLSIMLGYRKYSRTNLHWYSALSLFAICIAFDAVYYSSFVFVWTASVATLAVLDLKSTRSASERVNSQI